MELESDYLQISFWISMQSIPYSTLQQELDIRDLRELEDLIIEAIYAGIIQGKLDQKNAKVSVLIIIWYCTPHCVSTLISA